MKKGVEEFKKAHKRNMKSFGVWRGGVRWENRIATRTEGGEGIKTRGK